MRHLKSYGMFLNEDHIFIPKDDIIQVKVSELVKMFAEHTITVEPGDIQSNQVNAPSDPIAIELTFPFTTTELDGNINPKHIGAIQAEIKKEYGKYVEEVKFDLNKFFITIALKDGFEVDVK